MFGDTSTRIKGVRTKALAAAFPRTIPILTGFLFLGAAYGVFARASGLAAWVPIVMSAVVFGGSLEFVAVSLLQGPFQPVQAFLAALMIQARHLFYGVAILDKYRDTGRKRWYLRFGLCDESFSINCTAQVPEGVDRGWFYFFVTLLNHLYWVTGATIGALAGSLITLNTEGLDFVMTAMFVVIFIDQWKKETRHWTALIGLGASALCLRMFGTDAFLIPAMLCILGLLCLLRKPIERAGGLS